MILQTVYEIKKQMLLTFANVPLASLPSIVLMLWKILLNSASITTYDYYGIAYPPNKHSHSQESTKIWCAIIYFPSVLKSLVTNIIQ